MITNVGLPLITPKESIEIVSWAEKKSTKEEWLKETATMAANMTAQLVPSIATAKDQIIFATLGLKKMTVVRSGAYSVVRVV